MNETEIQGKALEALSNAFSAGNYANAYVSEDLDAAWEHEGESEPDDIIANPDGYRAAFVIGFFSSYEADEIPEEHRDEWIDAYTKFGPTMKTIGIAVEREDAASSEEQ